MNDTISSLKRVPSFGQTKSITHPCFAFLLFLRQKKITTNCIKAPIKPTWPIRLKSLTQLSKPKNWTRFGDIFRTAWLTLNPNLQLKKKATEAKEKADAADSNYKKVLEKANAHQTKFYTQEMPALLDVRSRLPVTRYL